VCAAHRREAERQDAKRREQAGRTRELVIRLPHLLAQEMCGRRGPARDEQVQREMLSGAGGADSSYELEILEHHVAGVATGAQHDRPPDTKCSGPVTAGAPREQRPGGIDTRVPRQRIEVVLGTHHRGRIEQDSDAMELRHGVAHVVVGDHDLFVAGMLDTGEDVADLAHEGAALGRDDSHLGIERGAVPRDLARRRSVDDEHVVDVFGDLPQIPHEITELVSLAGAQRKEIRQQGRNDDRPAAQQSMR